MIIKIHKGNLTPDAMNENYLVAEFYEYVPNKKYEQEWYQFISDNGSYADKAKILADLGIDPTEVLKRWNLINEGHK